MKTLQETLDALASYLLACIIAFAARAMALSMQRPPITLALLWELPVVACMGVIGSGLAEWLGYRTHAAGAVVACVAYLGPNAIATVFKHITRRVDP